MEENLNYRRKANYKSANKLINNYGTNYTSQILYPRPIFKIDQLDSYSYMTSIIHLIYQISPLYKYYHNKINSKNDKFSIHLHNTLVYYNNSKKSDISEDKRIIDITKLAANLYNLKNTKFIKSYPVDPVEFLDIIIKNSECADKFYIKNLKIKDECECNESSVFYVDKIQNIFSIPVKNLIELSMKNIDNIYLNKNKLISLYKYLIYNNYLQKINCPLNGIDCNYNRTTRKIFISNINESIDTYNKESLTENIFFSFQYYNFNKEIFSRNINLFNLLIMMPLKFDIKDLFDYEKNYNDKIIYTYNACIYINKSNYFSCLIKLKNKWIYYSDNEEKIFINYFQFIKYSLKNNLFPYILMYTNKNNEDYSNDDININQYEELFNYVLYIDDFKQKEINDKFQFFNISKNEEDLTLQQSSTECEEKKLSKLSISYNYNNINNSNTPIHITKNLELNSNSSHNYNLNQSLNKKNSCKNLKNRKRTTLLKNINNNNFYSENEQSLDGMKKLETFKLSPLSSGYNDLNNNNKSLNIINMKENNDMNYMIHSAKVYPLNLNEEKIKPFLITHHYNKKINYNNNENYNSNNNKMAKQLTDINLVNSLNPPEMWICQNCNKVNKALEYKCRLCKLINKKQEEIINIYNSLSIGEEETNCKNVLTTNNNIYNNIDNRRIRSKSGRVYINYKINNSNIIPKKKICACHTEMKDKIIKNNICILCKREVSPIMKNIQNKCDKIYMNKTSNIFYKKKICNNRFHSQSRLTKTKSSEKIKIKNKRKNKLELINKDLIKEYQKRIKNEIILNTQSIKK